MRAIAGYVENDAGMAYEHWSAAWTFEPDFWGVCGQGATEADAIADLSALTGCAVEVAERIRGDEQAFARDRQAGTAAERERTVEILAAVRPQTVEFIRSCSDAVLDWDDPERDLPAYARWRTIRLMAWHIADTESRYYLPSLGIGPASRGTDLMAELHVSYQHVHEAVETMPADLVRTDRDEVWTTTKVWRRLAWHERGELVAMRELAVRYRAGLEPAPR
jgi:hypothetical protein